MRSRTIAALVISGIAVAGALPVLAQQNAASATPSASAQISGPDSASTGMGGPGMRFMGKPGMGMQGMRMEGMRMGMQHPGMAGPGGMRGPGFLATGCGPKAAERIEIALVRLSYRLELTAAQQPLFDAFKTAALDAQAKLETACAADAPAGMSNAAPAADAATPGPSATPPDLLAMLKSGISIEQARLDAAQSVLPSFEALYNSLTDTQKAALMPGHGKMGGQRPGQGFHQGQTMGKGKQPGQGGFGRPADPGRQQPGRGQQTPAAPAAN